jgi:hypothetical protein
MGNSCGNGSDEQHSLAWKRNACALDGNKEQDCPIAVSDDESDEEEASLSFLCTLERWGSPSFQGIIAHQGLSPNWGEKFTGTLAGKDEVNMK